MDDDLVELQKRLESSGKVDLILAQVVYDRWKQVPLMCVVCSVVGERCSCCCGRSYCHVGSLSLDGGDCGVTVYPKQAFNVGHVDLLQVKFEDVDMDADTSAYGEDPSSCSCSLTVCTHGKQPTLAVPACETGPRSWRVGAPEPCVCASE